ncbi:MAG: hypothetical protein FWG77_06195 [Treponema sp.]|nr:hypothetical protein [Treponema sp.]
MDIGNFISIGVVLLILIIYRLAGKATRSRLDKMEKDFDTIVSKIERENVEALGRSTENVISAARSSVSELGFTAENIKRQVEGHRQEISTIIENAGKKAGKIEEAALEQLSKAAEDRIVKLKALEEEKLQNYQETAKARAKEVESLIKSVKEDWRNERAAWEEKDRALLDEHKKEVSSLNQLYSDLQRRFDIEYMRLEGISDATKKHDSELRKNMQEAIDKIQVDIDRSLLDWKEGIDIRLSNMVREAGAAGSELEQTLRREAELTIRAEISRHSNAAAENIKQYQKDLDDKLRELSEFVDKRNTEITEHMDTSRTVFEGERNGLTFKMRELDGTIEEARRRVTALADENDSRIISIRSSVDDVEKNIREAVKEAGKAEEIRRDMERRIGDLRGDIDRLDKRKIEIVQLENELTKVKRLEDEINSKMTRLLSDKRTIESIEEKYNRLSSVSKAVEEKLTQVTASDDALQSFQLQVRQIEEAIGRVEEKYQRVESKSRVLDNTNDGIDRNFKTLQESEKLIDKISVKLERYGEDADMIKATVEKLSGESERANEALDRIEVLNNAIEEVEERIKSIERARKWIIDVEARLEELNKQALTQARVINGMLKGKKSDKEVPLGEGAPPLQKKETVIILTRQGWSKEEIARNLRITIGEVELIQEMIPKDI